MTSSSRLQEVSSNHSVNIKLSGKFSNVFIMTQEDLHITSI
jgi:hypothetical protein